jgi:hypothetical protein
MSVFVFDTCDGAAIDSSTLLIYTDMFPIKYLELLQYSYARPI